MSLKDYLKSRVAIIFLNIIALMTLSVFLLSVGNESKIIITIAITWIVFLFVYFMFAYRKRRDYFKIIEKSVANIDKKFLIFFDRRLSFHLSLSRYTPVHLTLSPVFFFF